MNIKKFIARNNQEAIRMVKKEMGPEAVILRSRTIYVPKSKNEGDSKRIEVTAAVDYDAPVFTATQRKGTDLLSTDRGWQYLEKEIKEIKEALFCINEKGLRIPNIYFDQGLRKRFMNYKNFGLTSENIQELMAEACKNDHKEEKTSPFLQDSLSSVLSKIHVEGNKNKGKGKRIYSFIGPTGVGKTTTLAKLAAVSAMQRGEKTSLITLDTFRIAAVSQLHTYARIMGIPLETAISNSDLQKAIRKHSECDRIFIDTAGRSPNQDRDIHELKKIFTIPEEIHSYLVLSATSGYQNLMHTDERFSIVPNRSYIFTKLDETKDTSSMVNFLISQENPVAFFSAGQQVPEDIEIASKKRIASILLSELKEKMKRL